MRKSLILISIILTILITFFKGYDVRGVENLAYVIAIGIDKADSDDGSLSLTIQLAKPDSSENGGTKIKSETQTVTCNSFNLGIAMLNLKNQHQLNLSHCTAIVISEEFAREGIEDFINTLSNNIEIRPTCNIMISQDNAEEFLKTSSKMEDVSPKLYNTFINSAKVVSYVTPCQLADFYAGLNHDIKEPVAVYAFIEEDKIENLGLALFKEYKMIERISGLDTICYNMLTNNFENSTIEVYNPEEPTIPLAVDISNLANSKISVKLENGIPKINCELNVEARLLSASENYDFTKKETLEQVEAEINKFIKDHISDFLYRTSREYKSDNIGFEGYFKKNYLTQKEIDMFDWNDLYTKAEFEIEPMTYLVSGFLFSKN